MGLRRFDPLHLDVERFAEQAETLEGSLPLAELERLADTAHADAPPGAGDRVQWRASGERRPAAGAPQTWLHVAARTRMALTCQRCLQPIEVAITAERSIRFVADEATAAELDAESDDDVLATTRSLDLLELIEDELLLALPLVPRHDDCFAPPFGSDAAESHADDEAEHPFAALAALKPRGERE